MNNWRVLAEQGKKIRLLGGIRTRQETWLLDCLKRNQSSAYLMKYGVDERTSLDDFRKRLPLVTYDDLTKYIERVECGEENILFAGMPIAFERTSGSSGGNKLIPYTPYSLADFQAGILPWLADVIDGCGIETGCAYWSISPATRPMEITPAGVHVGLPDGAYLGNDAIESFVELSAVPPWVGSIQSVDAWKMSTLYWLLCRNDLALISVWSPTFFLMLLDALETEHENLLSLLEQGGNIGGHELPPNAHALNRLITYSSTQNARVLWPALKLVSCWADASSKPYFNELKIRLPQAQFQGKGLLSTEGVSTVPDQSGHPVLAVDSGFFEFLDAQEASCFAWELQNGSQYEVVMTTSGGLYRYRTGDIVQCEGYMGDLPVLRFLGRQGLASDIVGEKLTEQFVAACLDDIRGFRMLVPHVQGKPKYVLITDKRMNVDRDSLTASLEMRLSQNVQYGYARRIGQLDAVEVLSVETPLKLFMERMTQSGTRLGDIKVPSLRPEANWLTTFQGNAK